MDETSADTPLTAVLEAFGAEGFSVELQCVVGGMIHCGGCDSTFAAADFGFSAQHRVEGASDPADMMLVVGGPCPVCGRLGVLSVGYGPGTSEVDTEVVLALPDPDAPSDPVTQSD